MLFANFVPLLVSEKKSIELNLIFVGIPETNDFSPPQNSLLSRAHYGCYDPVSFRESKSLIVAIETSHFEASHHKISAVMSSLHA